MRKLICLFAITLSTYLGAQTRLDKSEIYLGGAFGTTASRVGFKPTVDQSFQTGYTGGAVLRYIGDKNVGFQVELNYSQRGWKESDGLYSKQLNYIELPFFTHIYIGNRSRLFINVGPEISYLLSEKTLINKTVSATQTQQTTPIQNKFDYGICFGLGFMVPIKKQLLQIEARGNFGLSDIYSNLKRDYFDASNNTTLSLSLGWMIQVK